MRYRRPKHLEYGETVRFHGHDGPLLALGYRLGKYLMKKLRPKGIMGLEITAELRRQKPYTCLLDGLQCSTFATLGKGNIKVKNVAREHIRISVKAGKRVLRLTITDRAQKICFSAHDLERAARRILRMPSAELWQIEK